MKVVICDDHRLFAEALAVVLRGVGHHVVACVSSPDQAIATVIDDEIDICLMDLHFPNLDTSEGSGVDAVARIVAHSPRTRVVVVSASSDPEELSRAVHAGARGLAAKDDDIHRVVDTMERVFAGDIVLRAPGLPPGVVFPAKAAIDRNALTRFLTPREREVLERLVAGQSTAELARAMGVRYSTARTHIQNTLAKLGVHSKLEAVAFAVSNRVVAIPDNSAPAYARATS